MVDEQEFLLMGYNHSETKKRKIELQKEYDETDGRMIRITDSCVTDDDVEVGDTLVDTENIGEYKVNNIPYPEEYDRYYRVIEVYPELVEEYKISILIYI